MRGRSAKLWRPFHRFIPQRSNNDLHASYTLLPDGPEATSGYVPSGIYGEGMAASMNARRAEMERSRKRAMMAEGDGLRGESTFVFKGSMTFGRLIDVLISPLQTKRIAHIPTCLKPSSSARISSTDPRLRILLPHQIFHFDMRARPNLLRCSKRTRPEMVFWVPFQLIRQAHPGLLL